jgi:phenylacetate-CoA ligase
MSATGQATGPAIRSGLAKREEITKLQERRLGEMWEKAVRVNPFYARKYAELDTPREVRCLRDLRRLPFTTKAELTADQNQAPPYGKVLTYPLSQYTRMHQTSGTQGRPLRWLDTPESWQWLLSCWETIFEFCKLERPERLFFPFSFGPFLGFWTAFEAAARMGHLCLAGGGMSTSARLRFMVDNQPSGVLCTPTYALRMAEVARQDGVALDCSGVRFLIVAGEPGGSISATRQRIESAWGARVFDHCGLTEVGALGIECTENPCGLHLLENECIVEVIDPKGSTAAKPGEPGELVLTNLGRWGSPLIRYRTGDLVQIDPRPCPCGRSFVRLEGGILGRTDDMIHLRGNNLYPGAIEAVIRRFSEIDEFRIVVDQSSSLGQLRIEVEPSPQASGDGLADKVGKAIRDELLFRAEIRTVAPGTLPRYEMKARRVIFE